MQDILVVCPQERDLQAIRAAGLDRRYRVLREADGYRIYEKLNDS